MRPTVFPARNRLGVTGRSRRARLKAWLARFEDQEFFPKIPGHGPFLGSPRVFSHTAT